MCTSYSFYTATARQPGQGHYPCRRAAATPPSWRDPRKPRCQRVLAYARRARHRRGRVRTAATGIAQGHPAIRPDIVSAVVR